MSYKMCTECNHFSALPQMKETVIQEMAGGTQPEIRLYTCPHCGYKCAIVDIGGRTITSAEETSIVAQTGLDASLVQIG